jgi:uncharacterized membrane-anchored protein
MRPGKRQEETTLRLAAVRPMGQPAAQVVLHALRKVPEVTVYFWIIKLMTTALGESTSDYLVHRFDPIIAVAFGGVGFVFALLLQLVVRRYVAWIYWLTVIMVAVFGTMAADVIHIVLHVPYFASAGAFAVALAIIFTLWYRTEKTLSIHSIDTFRRELFYWATVMATFALGTATGDLTANTFKLGYFVSGLLFLALICIPAIAYFVFGLNEVFAFWFAYILTRPLGASFADWTGKDPSVGGIGIGDGRISILLAIVISGFVAYLTVTRKDMQREDARSLAR